MSLDADERAIGLVDRAADVRGWRDSGITSTPETRSSVDGRGSCGQAMATSRPASDRRIGIAVSPSHPLGHQSDGVVLGFVLPEVGEGKVEVLGQRPREVEVVQGAQVHQQGSQPLSRDGLLQERLASWLWVTSWRSIRRSPSIGIPPAFGSGGSGGWERPLDIFGVAGFR